MRQIVLDTETTGLEWAKGERVVEIGCVEMVNRTLTGNDFHEYLNPERLMSADAERVHGLSSEFLADKPKFAEVAERFVDYVRGAELVIHNAPFDVGFLNAELARCSLEPLEAICTVVDTLKMARQMYPGKRASLDALCERFEVNNAHRTLHGALLDARILADVYLAMTRGQDSLDMDFGAPEIVLPNAPVAASAPCAVRVLRASEEELAAHRDYLEQMGCAAGW